MSVLNDDDLFPTPPMGRHPVTAMLTEYAVGDVVQIDPAHDAMFGGAFLVVTELKSWGVMGYCHPLAEAGGQAYYRVAFEHIAYVGKATWVVP